MKSNITKLIHKALAIDLAKFNAAFEKKKISTS
jgi:hypothetical protein